MVEKREKTERGEKKKKEKKKGKTCRRQFIFPRGGGGGGVFLSFFFFNYYYRYLSRRRLVNRAFQSHFQEKLRADRAVQPPGAEDGSPGEGLLVPQDDGVGQGRG